MGDNSRIEWTEATWNPVTGCTKVSPGCDHCYAERITERFHGKGSFAIVRRSEDKLYLPLRWLRPRRVFVNSMSDLFHDDVPTSFIARVFSVMAQTPQHTYQVLTKRHGRMRALLSSDHFQGMVQGVRPYEVGLTAPWVKWPLPNVWLGVSVEDQQWADIRIPALLETPSVVRWISAEPLLGPVDLSRWIGPVAWPPCWEEHSPSAECAGCIQVDWLVVGGESGPHARPMQAAWAGSLRDQCEAAGVAFFFKQWGEWVPPDHMPGDTFMRWDSDHGNSAYDRAQPWRVGKKAAGRLLDGVLHDAYPDRERV